MRAIWMACLVLAMACTGAVTQQEEPDCSNPRAATDSLLAWQQPGPDAYDLTRAITCVEDVPGLDSRDLARQLKQVLDARGLYVPVGELPIDPDYADDEGRHELRPVGDRAPVVLRRNAEGQWKYTESTMAEVPRLHAETFSGVAAFLQDSLPPAIARDLGPIQGWQLVFAALLLVLSWVSGQLVRRVLHGRVLDVARRFGAPIDRDVYARTNRPLTLLASLSVIGWGLPQLQLPIGLSAPVIGGVALATRIAGIVTALRFLDVLHDAAEGLAASTESKLDDQLLPLIRQAARYVIIALGLLFVLEALGVDVWKLMAGVSIGSLVFALAAQDTVANLFGSFNVFLDRPFQIGDWVVIGDVEGVVEEVGFRSTRIRTFHNSQVTVPNSKLTNANVDNMGRRHRRRVKMMLSLTYDTPPDTLQAYVEGVRAILAAHPGVEPTYEAHLYQMNASSLDVLVYYHLVVPGWHEELVARSQNILEFLRLAEELGVSFAFPSQSVYLESTPERPLASAASRSVEELQKVVDAFSPDGAQARPDGPGFPRTYRAQDL
jgi:MscS family membrane protein